MKGKKNAEKGKKRLKREIVDDGEKTVEDMEKLGTRWEEDGGEGYGKVAVMRERREEG